MIQELSDIHLNRCIGLKNCKRCARNLKITEPMKQTEAFIQTDDREALENAMSNLSKSVSSPEKS